MKTLTCTQDNINAFTAQLQKQDWSWVRNRKALKRYLNLLCLLKQTGLSLVPDALADSVLHQHLARPDFQQQMHTLFGQSLIHEVGTTENSIHTRNLYEQHFGPVAQWQPADCSISLAA